LWVSAEVEVEEIKVEPNALDAGSVPAYVCRNASDQLVSWVLNFVSHGWPVIVLLCPPQTKQAVYEVPSAMGDL
jgi:hypothetical protein